MLRERRAELRVETLLAVMGSGLDFVAVMLPVGSRFVVVGSGLYLTARLET